MNRIKEGHIAQECLTRDDVIYQALMDAIVEHRLPPASKLPEEALAAVFNISRTGIRKVLQRLAMVQMVSLTPKRGAQVASPSAEESRDIFHTRKLLEVANLPYVIEHFESSHRDVLSAITVKEQQAFEQHDGPAALRYSADFHIRLHAIAGNQVLTDMVTHLSQRSSLVIAAWGSPFSKGCRCGDHDNMIELLQHKRTDALSEILSHHFDSILSSLSFSTAGPAVPDFSSLFAGFKEQ